MAASRDEPRRIVIDTDPGTDDAIAILMALASPELEVMGLTAVAGNLPLAVTEANARRICALAGQPDVPVFAGCTRPLLRPPVTAAEVHGDDGLGGAALPPPTVARQSAHAVDWLVDSLMAAGEREVTLCPLGPLTNIAMALVKEPRIATRIREIVLMGGSARAGGNVTAAAEFNIHVDPHAAHVVFDSGLEVVMMPLDVTHQARMTAPRIAAVAALGGPIGDAAATMMRPHESGEHCDAPLHDPCVIAYLIAPEIFSGRRSRVRIETASEATMGMTVVDWRNVPADKVNCRVMLDLDADRFFALVTERLGRLVPT